MDAEKEGYNEDMCWVIACGMCRDPYSQYVQWFAIGRVDATA